MRVLVDTNIFLRSAQPQHPLFPQAKGAVSKLLRQGDPLFFCAQNIAEFWYVATRPAGENGLGMKTDEVLKEIAIIERVFNLLPDIPGVYPEWKRIVAQYHVERAQVFDARLVAVMNLYSIGHILTFDVKDFQRYANIEILDPGVVLSP